MTSTPPPDIPDEATREAEDGFADFDPDDAVDADDPGPGETSRGGALVDDLADVLRGAGLDVHEVDGWKQRQRSGTGYQTARPLGIIIHHTASPSSWDGDQDINFLTHTCAVAPMANLYLSRRGRWSVLAAGATNTNGKGGPWGRLPVNGANSRVLGIEAGNNGVGEPWPDAMQDSYVRGVAALADAYRIDSNNILAHYEWSPARKIDPAGPSRFGSVNRSHSWNMDTFRSAVNSLRGEKSTIEEHTPPPAAEGTYVVAAGDTWWGIAEKTLGEPAENWRVVAAANGGESRVLHPGDVLKLPGSTATPTRPDATAKPTTLNATAIPPFPGEARLDDHGEVVLAWQNALIAHQVIADNAANRDSHYGEGMQKAVLRLQKSWGWSDADGVAGKHTWAKLHGGA